MADFGTKQDGRIPAQAAKTDTKILPLSLWILEQSKAVVYYIILTVKEGCLIVKQYYIILINLFLIIQRC